MKYITPILIFYLVASLAIFFFVLPTEKEVYSEGYDDGYLMGLYELPPLEIREGVIKECNDNGVCFVKLKP